MSILINFPKKVLAKIETIIIIINKPKIVMNTQASRVVSGDQKPAGIEQIRKQVLQAIQDVHYGSVEITVHDGKIVQIERKEKIRLSDSALKHRHEFTAALWQQASPTGRTEA